MRVLYTLSLDEERRRRLEALGYTLTHRRESGPFSDDDLQADVLVTFNAFSTLDIEKMPNLKMIVVASTGLNQIPQETVERGIKIANNPQGYSLPIGEWIVAKVLESYKNTRQVYRQQEEKVWKQDLSIDEVNGKSALFIGTGNIAKEGAKRLAPFGVDIVGVNRSGKANDVFSAVLPFSQLTENISQFDIVVVVLPGTQETHKLINREMIEKMKDGSVFINISRGSVVEESALEELAGKFRAVHLDVFEVEPLPTESPLWEMDNVYVSSHTSWASSQIDKRRFENVYRNLKAFMEGEKIPSEVDLSRGY